MLAKIIKIVLDKIRLDVSGKNYKIVVDRIEGYVSVDGNGEVKNGLTGCGDERNTDGIMSRHAPRSGYHPTIKSYVTPSMLNTSSYWVARIRTTPYSIRYQGHINSAHNGNHNPDCKACIELSAKMEAQKG